MELISLTFTEIPVCPPPRYRPFEVRSTKEVSVEELHDQLPTHKEVVSASDDWLKLSDNAGGVPSIVNGWYVPRCGFEALIECRGLFYVITGFTDRLPDDEVALDDLRLYANRYRTYMTRRAVSTEGGKVTFCQIGNSLIQRVFGDQVAYQITPLRVGGWISAREFLEPEVAKRIVDMRPILHEEQEHSPSVRGTLGSGVHYTSLFIQGLHYAHANSSEERIDELLQFFGGDDNPACGLEGSPLWLLTGGSISVRELKSYFPKSHHSATIHPIQETPADVLPVALVGDDTPTVAATAIAHQLPCLVNDYGLQGVRFHSTNHTDTGNLTTTVECQWDRVVSSLSDEEKAEQANVVKGIINDIIVLPLLHEANTALSLTVDYCPFGLAVIDLKLGNDDHRHYRVPVYADGLFTPTLTDERAVHEQFCRDMTSKALTAITQT